MLSISALKRLAFVLTIIFAGASIALAEGSLTLLRSGSAGVVPPQAAFVATTGNVGTDCTNTCTDNIGFGTASATRRVAVTFYAQQSSAGALTISSATIGGVAAAIHAEINNAANTRFTAIISAAVPTGTSGNVIINLNAAVTNHTISSFEITNLQSGTPVDTDTNSTTSPGCSLSTQALGVAICGTSIISDTAGTTWTGMTEVSEVTGATANRSSAILFPTSTTTLNATVASGSISASSTTGASWR